MGDHGVGLWKAIRRGWGAFKAKIEEESNFGNVFGTGMLLYKISSPLLSLLQLIRRHGWHMSRRL